MKKISFLIVIILITFSAKSQDVVIKRFLNPPSLDGIVDDIWSHIDTNYIAIVDADYTASIISAYWKMGFTNDALYVLFEVEDNSFCPPTCSGYDDWSSDRPDFFLDIHTDTLIDGRGASNEVPLNYGPWYGHYLFTGTWTDNKDIDTVTGYLQWPKMVPINFAYTVSGDSYIYEYEVPFTSLTIDSIPGSNGIFIVEDGKRIGAEMLVFDLDSGEALHFPYGMISWKGTAFDGWANMDGAGVIELDTNAIDIVPPVSICRNIDLQLDASGNATLLPADIDNGSHDNIGIKNLSIDKDNFDCSTVGSNSVTLTVVDNSDNIASCTSTVTVIDTVESVNNCSTVNALHELKSTTQIIVYPNPVNNFIALNNFTKTVDIEIYDIMGQKVLFQNDVVQNEKINVSSLEKGIYLLKVNGKVLKFIKK